MKIALVVLHLFKKKCMFIAAIQSYFLCWIVLFLHLLIQRYFSIFVI
uniref:Uncharacterized protein n=1 Tax=Anguilla anguilla TaxID=7936 RepID=A0A0E9RLN1_ANGAN